MGQEIQFCTSRDGTRIAFTIYGQLSDLPVMIVRAWATTIELDEEFQEAQAFYRELAGDQGAVRFDLRGTGASQRDVDDVSFEAQVADLEAVVSRLGLRTFDIFGFAFGAQISAIYASRHAESVRRLILWAPHDYGRDVMRNPEAYSGVIELTRVNWPLACRTMADVLFPKGPDDVRRRHAYLLRGSLSAEVAAKYLAMYDIDIRDIPPTITTPTLVLNRRGNRDIPSAASRALASRMPDARFVEVEGEMEVPAFDYKGYLGTVFEFLGRQPVLPKDSLGKDLSSGTAIILFADIADSTALTERLGDAAFRAKARDLDAALRTIIRENAGTPIEGKLLGDGVLAVFASARQAIEAARACGRSGDGAGLPLHLGLHAGDVIREDNNVYGGAVNIASRISGLSAPGEVLVSRTVADLARTSAGVRFEDRGEQALKGVGDAVRLWAVIAGEGA